MESMTQKTAASANASAAILPAAVVVVGEAISQLETRTDAKGDFIAQDGIDAYNKAIAG